MRFRLYGIALGVFLALGLVFSFGVEAFADHGDGMGIKAEDVDPTSEANVSEFLDHIIAYYNQEYKKGAVGSPEQTTALVIYGRQLRQEGPYKDSGEGSKEMYSMGLSESGIVTNHARYSTELYGYVFQPDASDSAVANTIQALREGSEVGMPTCKTYGSDNNRVACATKVASTTGEVTVIAGLHHEKDDTAFKSPDCAEFTLDTTAEDVFNDPSDDNLQAYVKEVIGFVQTYMSNSTDKVVMDNLPLAIAARGGDTQASGELAQKILQEIYANVACFGSGDFKHDNIYGFVMGADLENNSTVLLNGNNFDLNGTNLELDDDQLPGDDKSIARLFNRELGGNPAIGDSATVSYHWDDPTNDTDDVQNFLRDGKVPGTSCKRSYIEVANINAQIQGVPPQLYIFGSGTYPGDDACASGEMMPESGDDDDGCAIAGAGHTSQGALLNLFLIASVLFSVVFLRRRA